MENKMDMYTYLKKYLENFTYPNINDVLTFYLSVALEDSNELNNKLIEVGIDPKTEFNDIKKVKDDIIFTFNKLGIDLKIFLDRLIQFQLNDMGKLPKDTNKVFNYYYKTTMNNLEKSMENLNFDTKESKFHFIWKTLSKGIKMDKSDREYFESLLLKEKIKRENYDEFKYLQPFIILDILGFDFESLRRLLDLKNINNHNYKNAQYNEENKEEKDQKDEKEEKDENKKQSANQNSLCKNNDDSKQEKIITSSSEKIETNEESINTKQKEMKMPKNLDTILEESESIKEKILDTISGQDKAVSELIKTHESMKIFQNNPNRPKAVYLFAGPPGVGKTYLAETYANIINLPFKRFDMSAYGNNNNDMISGLIGFEETYKNSVPGVLTNFVRENPACVLLIDEVEKAATSVNLLFLQILDGARLKDKFYNEDVDFSKAIIIFTTNSGKDFYEGNQENLSSVTPNIVIDSLANDQKFPKELLSRIAMAKIIVFNYLSSENLLSIVDMSFKKVATLINNSYENKEYISYKDNLSQIFLYKYGEKADGRIANSKSGELIKEEMIKAWKEFKDAYSQEKDLDQIKNIKFIVEGEKELNRDIGDYLEIPKPKALICDFKMNISPIITSIFINSDKNSNIQINYDKVTDEEEMIKAMNNPNANYDILILNTDKNIEEIMDLLEKITGIDIYMTDNINVYGEFRNINDKEKEILISKGISRIISNDIDNETVNKLKWLLSYKKAMKYLSEERKILDYDIRYEFIQNFDGSVEIFIDFYKLKLIEDTYIDYEKRITDKDNLISKSTRPLTKFKDIIGAEGVKKELKFFIDYIKNPSPYRLKGIETPRGILLTGPPGTGKTMLAKAAAGESNCNFISTTGADLLSGGDKKVKEIFDTAKRKQPCIIFIDEIDTIGEQRTLYSGGSLAFQSLLTEMDGFSKNDKDLVFVIGATNAGAGDNITYTGTMIDKALERRFASIINVDLPTDKEREKFAKILLEKYKLSFKLDNIEEAIKLFATMNIGKSFAYMEEMMQFILRRAAKGYTIKDLEKKVSVENIENDKQIKIYMEKKALEKTTINRKITIQKEYKKNSATKIDNEALKILIQEYLYGEQKDQHDENQYILTAYHEAGHAFVCWALGINSKFITIAPRFNYGGFILETNNIRTAEDIKNKIMISLGGRAAQEVYFGKDLAVNLGAHLDLKMATHYAILYNASLGKDEDNLLSLNYNMKNGISPENISSKILKEARKLLSNLYKKTIELIKSDIYGRLPMLAEEVIKKTQMTEEEILKVFEETDSERKDLRTKNMYRKLEKIKTYVKEEFKEISLDELKNLIGDRDKEVILVNPNEKITYEQKLIELTQINKLFNELFDRARIDNVLFFRDEKTAHEMGGIVEKPELGFIFKVIDKPGFLVSEFIKNNKKELEEIGFKSFKFDEETFVYLDFRDKLDEYELFYDEREMWIECRMPNPWFEGGVFDENNNPVELNHDFFGNNDRFEPQYNKYGDIIGYIEIDPKSKDRIDKVPDIYYNFDSFKYSLETYSDKFYAFYWKQFYDNFKNYVKENKTKSLLQG